jgi:hypothetical protein
MVRELNTAIRPFPVVVEASIKVYVLSFSQRCFGSTARSGQHPPETNGRIDVCRVRIIAMLALVAPALRRTRSGA